MTWHGCATCQCGNGSIYRRHAHDRRWGKSFSIVLDRLLPKLCFIFIALIKTECYRSRMPTKMRYGGQGYSYMTGLGVHKLHDLYSPFSLFSRFLLHFIAAFMCHHNTFLVYQSMRNATLERWEKVTHISIGFAWVVAALFGIAGYATFRALSQGKNGQRHANIKLPNLG